MKGSRADALGNNGGRALSVERIFVTPEEAAEALRIGRNLVYELMASGRLPSAKVGKLRRIRVQDLHEFAASMVGGEVA